MFFFTLVIFQYYVDWDFNLIICFNLFYTKLIVASKNFFNIGLILDFEKKNTFIACEKIKIQGPKLRVRKK